MGSGFSLRKKPERPREKEHQANREKFCSNCGCEKAKESTEKETESTNEQNVQVLNIEKEHKENETNEERKVPFHHFPEKEGKDDETMFVATSHFPYTKAKKVFVRQRVVSDEIKISDQHFPPGTDNGPKFKPKAYPKLHAAMREHLGTEANRSYHFVNDRRWSSPNVMPSSGYAPQKALPHRAVADLRRYSLNLPGSDQYDGFYSYNCQLSGTSRRPPTPSPSAWYPARRSDDYLVAPSLLAMERELDSRRRQREDTCNKDVHDF